MLLCFCCLVADLRTEEMVASSPCCRAGKALGFCLCQLRLSLRARRTRSNNLAAAAISSFPANVTHFLVLRLHHVLFWSPDPRPSHVELQRDRPDSNAQLYWPPRVFPMENIHTRVWKTSEKRLSHADCARLMPEQVFPPPSHMHIYIYSLFPGGF